MPEGSIWAELKPVLSLRAKVVSLRNLSAGEGAGYGLAFRCAGWGRRVVIAQFLKSGASGEVMAAERFPELTVLRTKEIHKFTFQMNEEEKVT